MNVTPSFSYLGRAQAIVRWTGQVLLQVYANKGSRLSKERCGSNSQSLISGLLLHSPVAADTNRERLG